MTRTTRTIFGLLMLLPFAASACATAQDTAPDTSTSTIYLVRHAEKQGGKDPSLTEEGAGRAARLAKQLADAGIEKIFSTDYQRTLETGQPLADELELGIILYDPSDLPGFADQLKSESGTVLVVGHSNTTPEMVILLGGEAEPMTESDYDRLYCLSGDKTVLLTAGGAQKVIGPGCP